MVIRDSRKGVRRLLPAGLVAGILLGAAACYPTGVETVEDLNTVTTVHDGGVDFGAFQTFAVADQVKYLEADGGTRALDPVLGNQLISAVQSNMTSRGYTQIVPTLVNQPNLAMNLRVVTVTYTNVYVSYPWCTYWGYYYPYCSGWGWYYPPITGVTQYDVGTLVITMATNDAANSRGRRLGGRGARRPHRQRHHRRATSGGGNQPGLRPVAVHRALRTNMRTLRLLALVVLLGSATSARAQLSYYGTVTYQLAFPIGETHQYIHDFAWRGVGLDFGYFVRPNITIGFALAWNVFAGHQSDRALQQRVDISGYQDRSLNVSPIPANARYFRVSRPSVPSWVRWASTDHQRLTSGSRTRRPNGTSASPQSGVFVPIKPGPGTPMSATTSLLQREPGLQFIGVHLGIGQPQRP